jgi:predicted nucleotidyltransferase
MTGAMALAERVATRLGEVPGVVAVTLGGSWARGEADAASDVDLGLYYLADRRPSVATLNDLAQELDDRHPATAGTEFGAWGAWMDGGAWLTIEGRRVDWLFRDVGRVATVVADCLAGRVACTYQPGHPHAFHAHVYAGEVHHARILHDPERALAALQAQTVPYPAALREAVVRRYL